MRRTLLISLAVLGLAVSAWGAGKKAGGKGKGGGGGCPFVGVVDIDHAGAVQNMQGLDPKSGSTVQAFDVDGPAGKMHVSESGDLRYTGGVPEKVKSSAFTHALVVDGSLKGVHVAQPDKDLPQGIFSDAVQIYLADSKGGRVALISIPGEDDAEGCTEIDCKVSGNWKKCWTDCK